MVFVSFSLEAVTSKRLVVLVLKTSSYKYRLISMTYTNPVMNFSPDKTTNTQLKLEKQLCCAKH